MYLALLACSAVLDGPTANTVAVSSGNEVTPVEITCTVTCLEHTDTGRYSPGLSFVVTKLGTHEEFQRDPGANENLYRDIEYTRMSLCEQNNNYMMQYTYNIYPRVNMSQAVVRCGVYFSSQAKCWGEQVVVIDYEGADQTTMKPMDCNCTPCPTSAEDLDAQQGPQGGLRYNTTTLSSDPVPASCDTQRQTIIIISVLFVVVAIIAAVGAIIYIAATKYRQCKEGRKVIQDPKVEHKVG